MNAEKFNEIRKTRGMPAAEAAAAEYIKSLSLSTPAERGAIWDNFRAESKSEAATGMKPKAVKTTASIKNICTQIIASSCTLSEKERKFVNDMMSKRKLTEKQASWLLAIAAKSGVKVDKAIDTKESKIASAPMSREEQWEHEVDMYGYSNIDPN